MSLLGRLLGCKKSSANVAKERLQIIISHERHKNNHHRDFLPKLQKEIVDVIAKYVSINREQVKIQIEQDGDNAILELNISMPDARQKETAEI